MKDLGRLSGHQLAILGVLWDHGEATVREVHEALEADTGHARKTTGTLMHRLDKEGVITHREDGREFVYRACVTRSDARKAAVDGVIDHLFQRELPALVSYALQAEDVAPGDLTAIRELLDAHDARSGHGTRRTRQKRD
ncbi:MAG: BlaI/MecI/CopY family transcriptional regulator [Gemmatimonadota bacterium]